MLSKASLINIPSGFTAKNVKCDKCPNIFVIIMPNDTQIFVQTALCASCTLLLKANKHLTIPYDDRLYLEHPHEVSKRRGHNV